MKCEKCGKNEATMYYKETINGVTREMHLCPECAQKEHIGGAFESAFGLDAPLLERSVPLLPGRRLRQPVERHAGRAVVHPAGLPNASAPPAA